MDKIIFINRPVVPIGPHPLNWDTQWATTLVRLNLRLLCVLDFFMNFYFPSVIKNIYRSYKQAISVVLYYYYYYYYSALGLVWTGSRTQSGDRYGSGKLHPWQVLNIFSKNNFKKISLI
jgi:hypothetical protein